jgi:hypothetical protein
MFSKCKGLMVFALLGIIQFSAEASVAVVPGAAPVALPGTTAFAEGDLGGTVESDTLIPFRIMSAAGALLFQGTLQDRVVRSSTTGTLHFYYRIRNTTSGLNGIIRSVQSRSFEFAPVTFVDWRPDGLGSVNPVVASRSPAAGPVITFGFNPMVNPLVGGMESRFFFVKTEAKNFNQMGQTRIILRTGESVLLKTMQPTRW